MENRANSVDQRQMKRNYLYGTTKSVGGQLKLKAINNGQQDDMDAIR